MQLDKSIVQWRNQGFRRSGTKAMKCTRGTVHPDRKSSHGSDVSCQQSDFQLNINFKMLYAVGQLMHKQVGNQNSKFVAIGFTLGSSSRLCQFRDISVVICRKILDG